MHSREKSDWEGSVDNIENVFFWSAWKEHDERWENYGQKFDFFLNFQTVKIAKWEEVNLTSCQE